LRKRLDVEIVGQGRRLRRVRAPRRRPQDAGASMALNIGVRAGPMLRMENFFNRASDVALDPSDGSFERREFGIDAIVGDRRVDSAHARRDGLAGAIVERAARALDVVLELRDGAR
jgi:hypothetical protein